MPGWPRATAGASGDAGAAVGAGRPTADHGVPRSVMRPVGFGGAALPAAAVPVSTRFKQRITTTEKMVSRFHGMAPLHSWPANGAGADARQGETPRLGQATIVGNFTRGGGKMTRLVQTDAWRH